MEENLVIIIAATSLLTGSLVGTFSYFWCKSIARVELKPTTSEAVTVEDFYKLLSEVTTKREELLSVLTLLKQDNSSKAVSYRNTFFNESLKLLSNSDVEMGREQQINSELFQLLQISFNNYPEIDTKQLNYSAYRNALYHSIQEHHAETMLLADQYLVSINVNDNIQKILDNSGKAIFL
ncbi:hypothetical protein [Marivirga sp.]|uniref:hypothetical protein n=1 Tax=Marivirga sp. TaxID=2018662 RepID=UPI0025D045A4|nr:hypothetical protein [Marivirga sp.]